MTTETECLEALREAAERLGESPTKAQYEELGLTPASATILKTVGSWNEAKARAGLETFERGATGGRDIKPKPDWVEIPDGVNWDDLTSQQRWYYKNKKRRIERKDRRREQIQRWLYRYKKRHCECVRCGEDRPPCLDFHHMGEKEHSVARMVINGHSKENIKAEIDRCLVLCANCHRIEHHDPPRYESP